MKKIFVILAILSIFALHGREGGEHHHQGNHSQGSHHQQGKGYNKNYHNQSHHKNVHNNMYRHNNYYHGGGFNPNVNAGGQGSGSVIVVPDDSLDSGPSTQPQPPAQQ